MNNSIKERVKKAAAFICAAAAAFTFCAVSLCGCAEGGKTEPKQAVDTAAPAATEMPTSESMSDDDGGNTKINNSDEGVGDKPEMEKAPSQDQPKHSDPPVIGIPNYVKYGIIPGSSGLVLVGAVVAAIILIKRKKNKKNANTKFTTEENTAYPKSVNRMYPQSQMQAQTFNGTTAVGRLHNIGRRPSQQDSMGIVNLPCGTLAVVADGMGGLSDGDKVSQKIVMTMLKLSENIKKMTADNILFKAVAIANKEVNAMLGNSGRMSSGSTLVSVLVSQGYLHWVSVGDSRIYLYRNGCMLQLNREHAYESNLIVEAVNGKISFDEIKTNSKRHGLTSFIGMGVLEYVDGSINPIKLAKGDKLILMSDGIYNTLPETEMTDILTHTQNAEAAAAEFERRIVGYAKPKQDNFTAIILDI